MAKEALSRIDHRKRERIFRNAAAEFARYGYHKANINSIARRAGIGKGSIYLYFADKRDLYLSTFKEAARIQNEVFDTIESMDLDAIAMIEKVFEESLNTFPRYRNMFKMYFDLAGSGNDGSLSDLARMLEMRSAEFFKSVLREGIASGRIRKDLPVEHAAYLIDSVYSIFFTTLANRYQKERFRVFAESDISEDNSAIEMHMRKILNVMEAGIVASKQSARRRDSAAGGGSSKGRAKLKAR